jgi:hypothetical protein
MGRLSETEVEKVEEHLLVCNSCQDLLTETDEFVGVMRAATEELKVQPRPIVETEAWWRRMFAVPAPMLTAAACAVLAVAFIIPREPQVATVELQTLRGPESQAIAPENSSLTLRLSLQGLDSAGPLRIEVASASGQIVARTPAERSEGLAIAKPGTLKSGLHWVRLYSGDELLREYGLNVR